eukprot:360365-Chlamydomonas_euryale.AAC.2
MSAPAMPPGSSPPLLGKPSPLGLDGGFTIAILAIALVLMAGDWVRPDINFLTTMAIYTAARFITVREAAAGFSNTGLLSVMALFAVAAGVARTGGAAGIDGVPGDGRAPRYCLGWSRGLFESATTFCNMHFASFPESQQTACVCVVLQLWTA